MDPRDFQGLYKYKLIVPCTFILSWLAMFLGPSFFPIAYQRVCIFFLIFLAIKTVLITIGGAVAVYRNHKVLKKAEAFKEGTGFEALSENYVDVCHVVVIPSYNESPDILEQTISKVAEHPRAKDSFILMLAMEAHETRARDKAQALISQFGHRFRFMGFTLHEVSEGQMKGKASNVTWCVQRLQPFLRDALVQPDNVMVTILDADSLSCPIYFELVEEHLRNNLEQRGDFIYQPSQMYTRNQHQVPVMSRVMEVMHSCIHLTNLFSWTDVSFSLSNYTISYNLLKAIGFWDTCAEAIGEDEHLVQKAMWKTNFRVKCVPIYTPFNQLNLTTGRGYWADLSAKFWQVERHTRAIEDFGYSLKMQFSHSFSIRSFSMVFQIVEIFWLGALIPWLLFSMTYQSKVLWLYFKPSPLLISPSITDTLMNAVAMSYVISFLAYVIVQRRSTTALHGLPNESLFHLLEYPIFLGVNLVLIVIPTLIISAFSSLFVVRDYNVAEKSITSHKQLQN